jgi:hypothetical protein
MEMFDFVSFVRRSEADKRAANTIARLLAEDADPVVEGIGE